MYDDTSAAFSLENETEYKKYSPLNAALYSAVIPGAGQFYTKSYWKSAAFFGAEVAMWIVYAIYEKKGDDKTNEFQAYADEQWSVVRYAYWIRANFYSYYNAELFRLEYRNNPPPIDVAQPWMYIDWDGLNTAEEQISRATDGMGNPVITGFTHRLAPYGDQQYYEMIGKYPQFGGGWDDASGYTPGDILTNNVSKKFLDYSKLRGDANSLYNIATTVTYVIVANHLISALEAAWGASSINKRLQIQGHIESRRIPGNYVEFVPALHLKYEF
jgi:hypothetical protein